MPVITESKVIYPEFKFFKNIYVSLNISDWCSFYWDQDTETVKISFSNDSPYYILTGEISGNTEFFKWIKTVGSVSMSIPTINIISKVLKKNATSIEYEDGEYFIFKYIDKETGAELETRLEPDKYTNRISLSSYNMETILPLSNDFLKNEICAIFRNNEGELTTERTKDKILEIPTARIKSLLKNSENQLMLSERDFNGERYVAIKSTNAELGLSLTQIFKTI